MRVLDAGVHLLLSSGVPFRWAAGIPLVVCAGGGGDVRPAW